MSKEYNGVTFFKPDEKDMDHRALKELSKVSLGDVQFPFGFFLVEEGGKTVVIPGTEQDRRKTLLKALPDIIPEPAGVTCSSSGSGCNGGCGKMPTQYKCRRMYDESLRYFGCGCVNIEFPD